MTQLSIKTLKQQACDETGLNDFGDPWFEEPLGKLLQFVNRDAGLISPESSAGARISGALADRLKLVDYMKQHPDAADEKVEIACAIVGLPRTGSTVVHRLLSSSPKLTALWWWETAFPLPLPAEPADDPTIRQEAGKGLVDWLLSEWPDFESIDPMDAMAVNEEVVLLDRTFLSSTYDSMMPIHEYGFWQAEQDHARAFDDLYLFMQAIQHQRRLRGETPRPWVFKTPHHLLGGIDGLLSRWPDVKLVMTHRHVGQVLPSYCSMCCSLSINSSNMYEKSSQGAYWGQRFSEGLDRLEKLRERLPDGQVIDVRFQDTVDDPVGTAERIIGQLGIEFASQDRAAMEQCMADNAREARPKHKYAPQEFGLTSDGIAEDFAAYHSRYL